MSITQAGLAKALKAGGIKLDPTAITRIEKGERGVGLNEALGIAHVLGCTLDHLLDPVPTPGIEEQVREVTDAVAQIENEIQVLEGHRTLLQNQQMEIEFRARELQDRLRAHAIRLDELREKVERSSPTDG